jgi:hypothetical protein
VRLLIERVGRGEVERVVRGMLVLCREARACVEEEPRGLGVPRPRRGDQRVDTTGSVVGVDRMRRREVFG